MRCCLRTVVACGSASDSSSSSVRVVIQSGVEERWILLMDVYPTMIAWRLPIVCDCIHQHFLIPRC
jgi:hypothetical protein